MCCTSLCMVVSGYKTWAKQNHKFLCQIRSAFNIKNRFRVLTNKVASIITNSRFLLRIGAYLSKIGARISNWSNYYKLVNKKSSQNLHAGKSQLTVTIEIPVLSKSKFRAQFQVFIFNFFSDFTDWSPWSNASDGKGYVRNRTCEVYDGITIKKVDSSKCNGSEIEVIGNKTGKILKVNNERVVFGTY